MPHEGLREALRPRVLRVELGEVARGAHAERIEGGALVGEPELVGNFLEFEKYVPSNNGLKNLRFHRRGDLTAVGTIYIRYLHNRRPQALRLAGPALT